MKNSLILLFCIITVSGFSQEDKKNKNDKNNEIKINIPYLVFGYPEITYERIFKERNAIGLSYSFTLKTINSISTQYIVNPYYRRYFGKEKALGFFTEGNVAVEKQKAHDHHFIYNQKTTTTNFGVGFALGTKFISRKRGYIGEVYVGFGKLFGVEDYGKKNSVFLDAYPRLGFNIGKRF